MWWLSRAFYVPLLMISTCAQSGSPTVDANAPVAPAKMMLVDNPAKVGECAERTIAAISDRFNGKLAAWQARGQGL